MLVILFMFVLSSVQFKPGMLVKLPDYQWGCALFEANGFQIIGSLPTDVLKHLNFDHKNIKCPPASFVQLVDEPLQLSMRSDFDVLCGRTVDPYTLALKDCAATHSSSKLDVFRPPPSQVRLTIALSTLADT